MIYIAQKLDDNGDFVCIDAGTEAGARAHCRSQGWFYLGAMGLDDLNLFPALTFRRDNP